MKTLASVLCLSLLSGCAALGALGYGATDVLPSLKYCQKFKYERDGIDMELQAKCRVPAG